jgi:hypothetical protein
MSSFEPKRPTFVHWLRTSGQIADAELDGLAGDWIEARMKRTGHKVYTTEPTTWDQFVASRYAHKVLAYQAYLRLTGAAPTLKKD